MKIGVYGDSFASPVLSGYRGGEFLWCNTLAKKLNASLTNRAKTGSSIFYSYQLFLKTRNQFDLCIFVVSSPHRYIKSLQLSSGRTCNISSIGQLEFHRKTLKLNAKDTQLFDWLEGWFLSSDIDYNECMTHLMVNDIITKKSNTIVYPGFSESLADKNIISFKQMHNIQLTRMGKDTSNQDYLANENHNKIAGHFTESFNNFISEMMYNKIKHGIDYDFSKLHEIEVDNTIDYYDFIN